MLSLSFARSPSGSQRSPSGASMTRSPSGRRMVWSPAARTTRTDASPAPSFGMVLDHGAPEGMSFFLAPSSWLTRSDTGTPAGAISILNSPAASLKGVTSGSLVGPSPLRNALGTSLPGTAQSTNAPLPDNDSAAAGRGSGADGIADERIGLRGLSTTRGSMTGSPAARSHRGSVSGPSPLAMQPPMSPAGIQPPTSPLAVGEAVPMQRSPRLTSLTPHSSHL